MAYSPAFALHVEGAYEVRRLDPATGMQEEQKVKMTCTKCGAAWQTTCASGQVREHVQRFALQHLHRDVFDPIPTRKP